MITTEKFPVTRTGHSRLSKVDFKRLEFGQHISDHILSCDFKNGAWQLPEIIPFGDLRVRPDTLALHYGQTVFEGMKAFRMADQSVNIFRPDRHYHRFNRSLHRLCMPAVPEEIFFDGLCQLIRLDRDWVPGEQGSSLYIRPFMFATEAKMGIKISEEYKLVIFSGPVPALFAKPVRVKVETEYMRAGRGGTGFAKCGGNYGAAFYPTQLAKTQGYDQVLWTGGPGNRFIEESGMMNALFVIDGVLITPGLSDSILDGVTRHSLLTLAADIGIKTEERSLGIDELKTAFAHHQISEAFGAGTAAVVAPIQVIGIEGVDYELPPYHSNSLVNLLKDKLTRIRTGLETDLHDWNFIVQ